MSSRRFYRCDATHQQNRCDLSENGFLGTQNEQRGRGTRYWPFRIVKNSVFRHFTVDGEGPPLQYSGIRS